MKSFTVVIALFLAAAVVRGSDDWPQLQGVLSGPATTPVQR